jgi:predicted nucleic acid-binding protein
MQYRSPEAKGLAIDSRDLFIGCMSMAHGYPLLTNNHRHLDRIPELLVLTPSDLDKQPNGAGAHPPIGLNSG